MATKKQTVPADYRDARGSNAGDEFHELWAVRKALSLLDRQTGLSAIYLEGVSPEADATEQNTWAGVDCGLYYGSDNVREAGRIEIEQLKYSGADPQAPWTIASLTKTTRSSRNNSIFRRLADAFRRLVELRGRSSTGLVLRLVSNKPVDPHVIEVLRRHGSSAATKGNSGPADLSERDQLINASGLGVELFRSFSDVLDLTSRTGSRFAIEEDILRVILSWTDDDTRVVLDRLRSFVGKKMLPEAKGELIVAETVLQQFNFASWEALFPCPSAIKGITDPVHRTAVSKVLQEMAGTQRICVHGGAGCGKTTALQEIASQLPNGSTMVVFDCYGAGRYLNSNAYRHRPKDAFLQLSNDLASQLRTPLLLSQSPSVDYPRSFASRVKRAADAIAVIDKNALLVLTVDAADNAVIAAESLVPAERSFVNDFVLLGDLPTNVRLLVTARSSRIESLKLPATFVRMRFDGFTSAETGEHAKRSWQDLPQWWIHDFHRLSDGNPRVQAYAIEYAGDDPTRALNYLRPTGKVLNQIFVERMSEAQLKAGSEEILDRFCEGLITLPRPIPWEDLSQVSELSLSQTKELGEDLAPGVRIIDNNIGFADEDFEDFVRVKVQDKLGLARARVAKWFMDRRGIDQYAASHVADALYHADRGKEVIALLEDEPEPLAIRDPLLRREVQLQRVRVGTRVSTEHEDNVGAVRAILAGAEAIKTDTAIRKMVIENPDLAATFMGDRAARMILLDPKHVENHGPLLFHLLLEDARSGNAFGAREHFRQLRAWMTRRTDDLADKRRQYGELYRQAWEIGVRDIAAEVEALLLLGGIEEALHTLHRWRPAQVRLSVARSLVSRLIITRNDQILRDCLDRALVPEPWNLLLLVPLALSGVQVDLEQLQTALKKVTRHRLARPSYLRDNWNDKIAAHWLDTIVTGCEVVFARGGDRQSVLPVLQLFTQEELRREDKFYAFNSHLIDLLLRAHTLLERYANRNSSLESFLIRSTVSQEKNSTPQVQSAEREHRDELANTLTPLLPLYNARAEILASGRGTIDAGKVLTTGVDGFRNQAYKLSRRIETGGIRRDAASSIVKLLCVPDLESSMVLSMSLKIFGDQLNPFGGDELSLYSTAVLRHDLHALVLKNVASRAANIAAMQTVARDKILATLDLSRFLLALNKGDANALFTRAHSMTEETDVDAAYQLKSLSALLATASPSLTLNHRRDAAADFMAVVCDAAVRLAEEEYFPWKHVVGALTTVHCPTAMAAVARWEDSGIADRSKCLGTLLTTALSQDSMTVTQVLALTRLLGTLETSLLDEVIRKLPATPVSRCRIAIEELAKEELLHFGKGTRSEVLERLRRAAIGFSDGLPWLNHLDTATRLAKTQSAESNADAATQTQAPYVQAPPYQWLPDKSIAENIGSALDAAHKATTYQSTANVLAQLETTVPLGTRIAYLDEVASLPKDIASEFEIADTIVRVVNQWMSPAVEGWCREQLPRVLVRRLPGFSGWLEYPEMGLPVTALFELIPAPDVPKTIIEGIAKNVDHLSAPTIYELTKLIATKLTSADCTTVIGSYMPRLLKKIPPKDLDRIQASDVPNDGVSAISRFLFSLLSDIDVRIRWRGAHAVRTLALMEEREIVGALLELSSRTTENTFRSPKAPFYWLAARLWLMIAVDRIAHETPSTLKDHGRVLFKTATQDIPHVLIRSFARDAVMELVNQRVVRLSPKERRSLGDVNASKLKRRKRLYPYGATATRRTKPVRERRFHFDVLDTTRYWYEPATRVFADISEDTFLDTAESWIIDKWNAPPDIWQWDKEPRRNRLSERQWQLWSHSHGSEPTLERYSTYLEWHAMFCAVGELMEKHAFAATARDYYQSFEHWLEANQLTYAPYWLADVRAPKPGEVRFWQQPPVTSPTWITCADDKDFLTEIGIGSGRPGMLTVDAYHDNRFTDVQETVRVSTALVAPEVALPLVRALQTTAEPYDYKIPVEGDNLEIDEPPYRLRGWLPDGDSRSGIDQRDPFRNQIAGFRSTPGTGRLRQLQRRLSSDGFVSWQSADGETEYLLQEWSDTEQTGDDSRRNAVGSNGMRLMVSVSELQRVLRASGFDLIAEVAVTRKKAGREYERFSQEETIDQRYDRVFLLRKDGKIKTAEGDIGTWFIPS